MLWWNGSKWLTSSKQKFKMRSHQLGLFEDDKEVIRCQGRLGNSELTDSAKYPILLDTCHHLITLVVWRVMHGGVKETLTELRSNFWIVRGR